MAWTLEDLAALEKAIATGASRVKYADKEAEYRTLPEMWAILAEMKEELGLNGSTENPGRRYGSFSKGLQ